MLTANFTVSEQIERKGATMLMYNNSVNWTVYQETNLQSVISQNGQLVD